MRKTINQRSGDTVKPAAAGKKKKRKDWHRKITQNFVDTIKPPKIGRAEYVDAGLPGLTLRVTDSGHKSWSFMYRYAGKLKRLTLGDARTIEMAGEDGRRQKGRLLDHMGAREAAFAAMKLLKAGKDPAVVREAEREAIHDAAANTVTAVVEDYLEQHVKRNCRASTYDAVKRNLDVDVVAKWAKRPIASITSNDVKTLLKNIVKRGAAIHANNVLTNVRSLFLWAVGEGKISVSPTAGIKRPTKPKSRERALNADEIKALWMACHEEGWPYGPLTKLLLLTGQRRSEVAEMRWAELDLDAKVWTIPRERAKNDRSHIVHLSEAALAIIKELPHVNRGALVFTYGGDKPLNGWTKAKERLREHMPGVADDWSHHDLRRTMVTRMADDLGIAQHVADKILNHVSDTISGTARVYQRAEFITERRAALDAWARYVLSIVEGGDDANVLEFKRRRTGVARAAASA